MSDSRTKWICIPSMFVKIFPDIVNCDSIGGMIRASIIYPRGTNILIHKFSHGLLGASLATSILIWMLLIILLIYAKFSKNCNYTWEGLLTIESFEFLLPNLKISLPSAIMVCLEYWSFEILVLLAGPMPNSESSTSLVAMCTRVSTEIGAGNIKNAKNAVSMALKLSYFLAPTVLLSLAFGRRVWALSFTESIIYSNFLIRLLFSQCLYCWILPRSYVRGSGWQHLAAWTYLVAFYMIGMPVALLFGFKLGFYDKGPWMGLCCGLFCRTTILLLIIAHSKWSRIDIEMAQDDQRLLFGQLSN